MINTCKKSGVPARGTFGDIWFAIDAKETYLVVRDGSLLNLSDLFAGQVPARLVNLDLAVQDEIKRQVAAAIEAMPKPVGPPGPRGDVTVVGDGELQEAVAAFRRQKAWVLADISDRLARLSDRPGAQLARQHLLAVKKELERGAK